jgi:beta-lactamase superfamily II metal-dependent hydrolase
VTSLSGTVWRIVAKYAGAAVVLSLLVTVACTKINTEPAEAPPAPEQKQEVLRTNEVFDKEKYKGLLTIRYFYLKGDVGTGDCILVQTPDGKTMMIDAGVHAAASQVIGYLNRLGVNTIDVALNTHPHSDHIGGFATVAQMKDVKQFYMIDLPYESSSAYNRSMNAIRAKNIPVKTLEEGDTFQLGNEVKVEVLSPPKGVLPGAVKNFETAEINNHSMVLKMTYKDNSFLITGDIYNDREYQLVADVNGRLDSDMMDAPHHGHQTSSAVTFIRAVSPKMVAISSNIFNSLQVYNRYKKENARIASTGLNGNILITSDGKNLNMITEKDSALDTMDQAS